MGELVGIVNYGIAGNIFSIQKALVKAGGNTFVINEPSDFNRADKIVIPGVGSFKDAMDELYRVSQDFSIVSFTVDSFAYRLKKTLLRIVKPGHSNAPAPMRIDSIRNLIVSAGFNVDNELMVAPFLSGETVFWLSSNKSKRG